MVVEIVELGREALYREVWVEPVITGRASVDIHGG